MACYKWLRNRNCALKRFGITTAEAFPARPKFKCGGGRMEENRLAADAAVEIAGRGCKFSFCINGFSELREGRPITPIIVYTL